MTPVKEPDQNFWSFWDLWKEYPSWIEGKKSTKVYRRWNFVDWLDWHRNFSDRGSLECWGLVDSGNKAKLGYSQRRRLTTILSVTLFAEWFRGRQLIGILPRKDYTLKDRGGKSLLLFSPHPKILCQTSRWWHCTQAFLRRPIPIPREKRIQQDIRGEEKEKKNFSTDQSKRKNFQFPFSISCFFNCYKPTCEINYSIKMIESHLMS